MKKLLAGIAMLKIPYNCFFYGAGSIFNISGTLINISGAGDSTSDILAIKKDWYEVGNYLRKAAGNGR